MRTLPRLNLTFTEEEVWRRFEAWLNLLGKKERFSSDDMREMGLIKLLPDPKHQVGAIFHAKQSLGIIKEIDRAQSRIPSNHKREIRVYKLAR